MITSDFFDMDHKVIELGGKELKAYILENNEGMAIVDYAFDSGYEVKIIEGTLLDSYLVYNDLQDDVYGLTNKYIFIVATYVNEYSSEHVLFGTDDDAWAEAVLLELVGDESEYY